MTAKLCISASLVRYAPCWKRLSNTQHLRTFQASCSRVFKVAAFQFIFQICFKPCQVCIQPADMLIHLHRRGNHKLNYFKKTTPKTRTGRSNNLSAISMNRNATLEGKAWEVYQTGKREMVHAKGIKANREKTAEASLLKAREPNPNASKEK